jgi:hypothetical protein
VCTSIGVRARCVNSHAAIDGDTSRVNAIQEVDMVPRRMVAIALVRHHRALRVRVAADANPSNAHHRERVRELLAFLL